MLHISGQFLHFPVLIAFFMPNLHLSFSEIASPIHCMLFSGVIMVIFEKTSIFRAWAHVFHAVKKHAPKKVRPSE